MHHRRGFTLVELLVVVGIVALLVSMLLPALQKVRRQAMITACASNMRQTFFALTTYANDYKDYVWNYGPGPHDHTDPQDGVIDYHYWFSVLPAPGAQHAHYFSEGYVWNSYWRGILIERHYAPAAVLGCSVSIPDGWYLTSNGNTVEPNNSKTLLKNPPFIYRGRAVYNDVGVSVYAGGNIACTNWSDEAVKRRTAHLPTPNQRRPAVLLNCPVWGFNIPGDNKQQQPHQLKNDYKLWSEFGGFGFLGHITAENVCWNDGSVLFMDSGDQKFRYINPETRDFGNSPIIP